MNIKIFLTALTVINLIAGICVAQDGETTNFSASIKSTSIGTVSPSTELNITRNISGSYNHTFLISPSLEDYMSAQGATINITGDFLNESVSLEEDPRFAAGRTSAKITKILDHATRVGKLTATVKWGQGLCSVNLKIKVIDTTPPLPARPQIREQGHPRATVFTQTTIDSNVDTISTAYVTVLHKSVTTEVVTTDYHISAKTSEQIKSVAVVDPPPAHP